MLTGKDKRKYRADANHINPEIIIGKDGVALGVITNLENALKTKEIVKIKLLETCPEDTKLVAEKLCKGTNSELVQIIGRTVVVFRKKLEE